MKTAVMKAVAALSLLACQGHALAQVAPVVTTAQGQISGVKQNGADAYLGIPFAQPPVGALRWKPPVKPDAWTGVRDGSRFGANCYQSAPATFGPYTPEFLIELPVSEDCLYLNVWTPGKRDRTLPVIVWIHGGGFGSGSGSIPIYNGSRLAAKGVVVVSVNYRLGAFGFLAHPELTAESPRKTSGNYGLLDIVAALEWVKANISPFGGNPNRVTVMGQSAGAVAVNNLLMSPGAKGLFVAGIAESGSGGGSRDLTLASAESQGVAFARKMGAASLDDLRRATADAVRAAAAGPPPGSGGPAGPRFATIVDGTVLKASAGDAVAPLVSKVPLLTGYNIDEVGLGGLGQKIAVADFEKRVRQRYAGHAEGILALYPHGNDLEASDSAIQLARDEVMTNMAAWAAERVKASGQTVYGYLFDHPYPVPEQPRWGSFHTAEVPYVFGALDYPGRAFTQTDQQIAQQVQGYWVNFATRGNPNAAGQSTWPKMGPGKLDVMQLGDRPGVHPGVSTPQRLAALREARAETRVN